VVAGRAFGLVDGGVGLDAVCLPRLRSQPLASQTKSPLFYQWQSRTRHSCPVLPRFKLSILVSPKPPTTSRGVGNAMHLSRLRFLSLIPFQLWHPVLSYVRIIIQWRSCLCQCEKRYFRLLLMVFDDHYVCGAPTLRCRRTHGTRAIAVFLKPIVWPSF
jgi:hypothetical protein